MHGHNRYVHRNQINRTLREPHLYESRLCKYHNSQSPQSNRLLWDANYLQRYQNKEILARLRLKPQKPEQRQMRAEAFSHRIPRVANYRPNWQHRTEQSQFLLLKRILNRWCGTKCSSCSTNPTRVTPERHGNCITHFMIKLCNSTIYGLLHLHHILDNTMYFRGEMFSGIVGPEA